MTMNRIPEGTEVIYSCDAGFTRVGPEGSVCLNTGEWSPKQPPVCQGASLVMTF